MKLIIKFNNQFLLKQMGNTHKPLETAADQHSQSLHTQLSIDQNNPFKPALATHSYMGHRLTTLGHRDGENGRRIGFDLPGLDMPGQQGILIYISDTEFVRIHMPISSGPQTVAWLLQAVLKQLKEDKKEGIVNTFLKTKSVVGFRCRTSKSECMDHLLTKMETDIQFLTDNDILETVYATKRQFAPKRKPLIQDFDFLKVIGKGGFSNVYQVRKKDDGKIYALKCLKKHLVKQENKVKHVMNEKSILSIVDHPFIVKMNWAFQADHYLFMVLDFCAGGEIFYHMNKVQRFSEKMAKFYFSEILLALEYLHQKNIFYRDLKPENVLLDEDGHVKLADFGISRKAFGERDRSNSFCGSPEYMSPEMLKQDRIHGRVVDFYSLGCLLYEMLTGLPPHFSENREEMYRRILHNPVDYPRYLSLNSKNILKALLTKDPNARLGSMLGAKEIKEHPFCKDINWDSVFTKKLIPPIKPSLRYSNFDQEYTTMPIRFTYEEDFLDMALQRRKSDPGLEQSIIKDAPQGSIFNINGFNRFIQGASHLWNNPTEIEVKKEEEEEESNLPGLAMTMGNQPRKESGQDSPGYSRPPSSTFKGYSFMNFRNDSVSSVGGNDQRRKPDKNLQNLISFDSIQQQNLFPRQKQDSTASKNTLHSYEHPLSILPTPQSKQQVTQTPQQKQGDLDPASQSKHNINVVDDYEFAHSQRSRTISFANQSIVTEGADRKQNDLQPTPFITKEEQKEIEKLMKKQSSANQGVKTPSSSYQSGSKKMGGQSPSTIGDGSSKQQRASATIIGLHQGSQDASYFNQVIKDFDYQKEQTLIMLNMDIMHDIKEDVVNEQDSSMHFNNQQPNYLQVNRQNTEDKLIKEITHKLQDNRKLNAYEKNMIKFNDAVHSVHQERKRNKAQNQNKQTQKIKEIKHQNVRKVTRSLYQKEAPMAGVTIENRQRGESNYTVKSDHRHREGSADKESKSSNSKSNKFQSSRIGKKPSVSGEKNLQSRKTSRSKIPITSPIKPNASPSKAISHMSPKPDTRNPDSFTHSMLVKPTVKEYAKTTSKTLGTLKIPTQSKEHTPNGKQEITSPTQKPDKKMNAKQSLVSAVFATKKSPNLTTVKSRNLQARVLVNPKSHLQPPLSTKHQKPPKNTFAKGKPPAPEQEDSDDAVVLVESNPVDSINDWHKHKDSVATSGNAFEPTAFSATFQPKNITRYNSPKGGLQDTLHRKVAVASIAIPQTSRNAAGQPNNKGTRVAQIKGNRLKTNSQWTMSSLKKDLIDMGEKTAPRATLIAQKVGPKKQNNLVDQLSQKKLLEKHKSNGSRSYRCQSEENDFNIDEFNSGDEPIDQVKTSLLSSSIHQNQGKHYSNQVKEQHVTSNPSLLTPEKVTPTKKTKKAGKNTAVVNLNSMHERLKSSFITQNIPREAIEQELLVRSPEQRDKKQPKILSGETKLQHQKASNSIVESKHQRTLPFHSQSAAKTHQTLTKSVKKKSGNMIAAKPSILTQSYSSVVQKQTPISQGKQTCGKLSQAATLNTQEDDKTDKAFSFREESEQTPMPVSTQISLQAHPTNSTRETPQAHDQKTGSITKQLSDCRIVRPGSESQMEQLEQQSSKSSVLTQQSKDKRLSGLKQVYKREEKKEVKKVFNSRLPQPKAKKGIKK